MVETGSWWINVDVREVGLSEVGIIWSETLPFFFVL